MTFFLQQNAQGTMDRVLRNDAVRDQRNGHYVVPTSDTTKWVADWADFKAAGGMTCNNGDQTEIELLLPAPYKFSIQFGRALDASVAPPAPGLQDDFDSNARTCADVSFRLLMARGEWSAPDDACRAGATACCLPGDIADMVGRIASMMDLSATGEVARRACDLLTKRAALVDAKAAAQQLLDGTT